MACIDLLIWIGQPKKRSINLPKKGSLEPVYKESRYSKIKGYIKEALEMGCCRRIHQLPPWIVLGKSRVFLVHKGDNARKEWGSLFGYYVVKRIELITGPEGSRTIEPAAGQVPWSETYYMEFKRNASSCRGAVDESNCIRNKLPKSLARNFPRDFSKGKIIYRSSTSEDDNGDGFDDFIKMLKDIFKDYIEEHWLDFLESYEKGYYKIVPNELSECAGGLACSKRHVPGAVYLVNELYSQITDTFHDKFYHWLEYEGLSKYPNFLREELIAELKKTERNPNEIYPEEGIELYRQAKEEVLKKRNIEADELHIFKKPYPIFQSIPSAAFRGYRRIDGDVLLEQINDGGKRIIPVIPYCSGVEIDPDKPLTKSQFIAHFTKVFGLQKVFINRFLDEMYNLAIAQLKRNKSIIMPGFGKLVLSERKEHYGRNPRTNERILIPAKKTAKLRVAKEMKDELNS